MYSNLTPAVRQTVPMTTLLRESCHMRRRRFGPGNRVVSYTLQQVVTDDDRATMSSRNIWRRGQTASGESLCSGENTPIICFQCGHRRISSGSGQSTQARRHSFERWHRLCHRLEINFCQKMLKHFPFVRRINRLMRYGREQTVGKM